MYKLAHCPGAHWSSGTYSDINGEITTDGTWEGCKRVGGTKDGTSSLDGITSLPNHSADWSAAHIYIIVRLIVLVEGSKGIHLMSPGKNGLVERSSSRS